MDHDPTWSNLGCLLVLILVITSSATRKGMVGNHANCLNPWLAPSWVDLWILLPPEDDCKDRCCQGTCAGTVCEAPYLFKKPFPPKKCTFSTCQLLSKRDGWAPWVRAKDLGKRLSFCGYVMLTASMAIWKTMFFLVFVTVGYVGDDESWWWWCPTPTPLWAVEIGLPGLKPEPNIHWWPGSVCQTLGCFYRCSGLVAYHGLPWQLDRETPGLQLLGGRNAAMTRVTAEMASTPGHPPARWGRPRKSISSAIGWSREAAVSTMICMCSN